MSGSVRYDDPELRERLAAEYVLGTMPHGARRRFERLIANDASLAAVVAAWQERFAPLDAATPETPPPARVWRKIERRLPPSAPPTAPRLRRQLLLWRGLSVAALAACVGLALYIGLAPSPPSPVVAAVLSDRNGLPALIATTAGQGEQVSVAAMRALPEAAGHSLELWGIAGGAPRPLGLVPTDRPLRVGAAALPAAGGTLAVSQEPVGGSSTGLPTGPVLFQGKVLAIAR